MHVFVDASKTEPNLMHCIISFIEINILLNSSLWNSVQIHVQYILISGLAGLSGKVLHSQCNGAI
jgi:hypothetical protein